MKTQNVLTVLATTTLLGLSVGCQQSYDEGFAAGEASGYDRGYDDGYADGDEAGFERAKVYFASADYNKGFEDGKTLGLEQGYNQGYSAGRTVGRDEGYTSGYSDGRTVGRNEGYNLGYNDGYGDGYDDGYVEGGAGAYEAGYSAGYTVGYTDGNSDGYENGYDDGFGDGYDAGYGDGFDDGYGLSVGKTKKLKGYANLLSLVHNDLFDYTKIKAPKKTSKGLVVGRTLLLSDSDSRSKDTLKKSAVVEQYLILEMAKQVKSKFGLSDDRALKIAKASNHFRKYASTRALTAEDTNAYAEEIIGVNFKTIHNAYTQSMKGDVSELNSVLQKAAAKNGISTEKMSGIVTKLFL